MRTRCIGQTDRERMTSSRTRSSAPYPSSIYGSPAAICGGWLFTLMHHQNVNDVRWSTVRRDGYFDVEQLHDNLASVNDTSASLELRDLDRAMAKLPIGTDKSSCSSPWKIFL